MTERWAHRPPLLIAEAANPEWFSVPLEGWSHARAIQDRVGGHIVTQVRNAPAFERAGVADDQYTAIDSEKVAARIHGVAKRLRGGTGKGWTTVMAAMALPYYYFEKLVWDRFGPAIRAGEYSLVHRITPLSPTLPSTLAARCAKAGVPFMLGPLNGGVPWPKAFDRERRSEREWLSYVRGAYRLLPARASTLRHASAIVCGSQHTLSEVPGVYRGKTVYIAENGIDPERFARRRAHTAKLPIRCVFLGRLVPYKGCDMLLEAIAPLARSGSVELTVIGDGPERARLETMARDLEAGEAVRFVGHVPHTEVQDHLQRADLLTFPSIREFGGAVIVEAMAVGVVPMAVAYAGPAELMTEASAFPVPIGGRASIVSAMRARLEEVVADPSSIDARSAVAVDRAHRLYSWNAKSAQTEQVYRWILGERRDKPRFDFSDRAPGEHAAAAVSAREIA
ncbi:MAG: glycosyltransferase family 4 protein [Planctomycetota bacterium]